MFTTVTQAEIRDGVSSDKEKTKLANALRRAANTTSVTRQQLSTAGTATYTAIWTSDDMPEGAFWPFSVTVAAFGSANLGWWMKTAIFSRGVGGPTTQFGGTIDVVAPLVSDIGLDVRFVVVGNAIALQVFDNGNTLSWDAVIETREVTA